MRVVSGKGGQAPALAQKLIEQIPAITPVVFNGAAMVVDFHRMGAVNGAAILDGELRPGGVRYADESAGFMGAAGNLFAGFIFSGGREIKRQASGHDMPEFANLGLRGVQFRAEDGGEIIGAQGAGVGDGPIIVPHEMIRQHHEIIAGVLVGLDHPRRFKSPIRQV